MYAPMLARSRRKNHCHCDCHDNRGNRAFQAFRRAHKRTSRARENRAWRRDPSA